MSSKIEIFRQILTSEPTNSIVLFGLAKEYEKLGLHDETVTTLKRYLELSEDQGNAFGMLARAYEGLGQRDNAKQAYHRGVEAALKHGHPGMAEEYRMVLTSEYED